MRCADCIEAEGEQPYLTNLGVLMLCADCAIEREKMDIGIAETARTDHLSALNARIKQIVEGYARRN
jgi:hypothetical protein